MTNSGDKTPKNSIPIGEPHSNPIEKTSETRVVTGKTPKTPKTPPPHVCVGFGALARVYKIEFTYI